MSGRCVLIQISLLALILIACRQAPTVLSPSEQPSISVTESVAPTSTSLPTVLPSVTILPESPRVILVSIPGGRADWVDGWIADGTMPNLDSLRRDNIWMRVTGVDPASNGVSHNSLAAGRWPSHTGVPGEHIHRPEDDFWWYTSAFDLPYDNAQPIWQAASQQGLKTAALFWPGGDPRFEDQLADYTIGYSERDAYSKLHNLTLAPAASWVNPPDSFSPLLETQFVIKGDEATVATVYILAADTTDDQIANPDTFILSSMDQSVDVADLVLHTSGWGSLQLDSSIGQGGDFFISSVSSGGITLFQSDINHIMAEPNDLLSALVSQFGFFPPAPDYYALEHGWIAEDQYLEMLRRQSDWMMDVTLWVDSTYHPDLLMTVQSPLDQAGYQFLLVDPLQPGYSPERSAQYQDYLRQAASQLDTAIGRLLDAETQQVEDGSISLWLVGTTGLAPAHTQVNLNKALADAGLLRLGRNGFVVVQSSQAIAFSSGGSAHIYINLVGREKAGIVTADQYSEVQARVAEVLSNLVDPSTGEAVLEHIYLNDELNSLDLDGRYSGDVFVQAKPGYSLSDERRVKSIFAPVTYYGQQGYDSSYDSIQGGLLVAGKIVPSNSEAVRLIDIAPSIADLLGIGFPGVDGISLFKP